MRDSPSRQRSTCAALRAPRARKEHAAVSMVQALRFIMRDSRPIQMSKDERTASSIVVSERVQRWRIPTEHRTGGQEAGVTMHVCHAGQLCYVASTGGFIIMEC